MRAIRTSLEATTTTRRSLLIYLTLMVYLILVTLVLELGSVEVVAPSQASAFGWPVIALVAILGGFCVWLTPRTGIRDLWDPSIPPRQRLLLPALVGLGLGAVNLAFGIATSYPQLMAEAAHVASINVAFPESILVYSGGAIIVEALYRLILITLPLWLIANVILRGRGQAPVFWILAALTSLLEPVGQLSLLTGRPGLMLVLGVASYGVNMWEALLFRRYGFLATLAFRVAYYLVWHVVGGVLD